MKESILRLFITIIFMSTCFSAFSQVKTDSTEAGIKIIDSLKNSGILFINNREKPEIVLSTSQAVRFLRQRFEPQYWNDSRDPFRLALGQLIFEASHPPYD